jgi:hypothetical protein
LPTSKLIIRCRRAPDGYTFLVSGDSVTSNPHVCKMNIDVLRDLVPIVQISDQPIVLAAHPSLGVKSIAELVALAAGEGLSSSRRVEALVARLVHSGFLAMITSKQDRRVRILTPTERMFIQDQNWLAAHYLPLQVLFPDPGYGPMIQRDRPFQMAQRLVSMDFFGRGANILASNPGIMLFLGRDAGVMILIKLIQMAHAANEGIHSSLSYADIGARFGVSRTHVREVLLEAERAGYVRLSGRGGQLVQLTPAVMQVFDRFIADSMCGNDLIFQIASKTMTGSKASIR